MMAVDGLGALDSEPDGDFRLTVRGVRADTAGLLHGAVAGMSLENFVVRPKRRWVETWSKLESWKQIGQEEFQEIGAHLSGLPTALRDDDEDAKRFDLLMLRVQLSALNAEPGFDRLKKQVRDLADGLLELGSIPAVRDQMLLIEAVAGEEWWQDVTLPMLEQARRKLRALIKLIEMKKRKIVYTDFEDEIGESVEVQLHIGGSAGDFERFRAKVRVFLRAHESHITLYKLRRNMPLTAADLTELERMLVASGLASTHELQMASTQSQGLGLFVRSLVGLDRDAANAALAGFVQDKTLSANQIEFVNLVVKHLTENGAMDAALLYEPPFTSYAPQGPDALFTSAQVEQLIGALQEVRANALAA
jgi:type I restriction enzyme R subunit